MAVSYLINWNVSCYVWSDVNTFRSLLEAQPDAYVCCSCSSSAGGLRVQQVWAPVNGAELGSTVRAWSQ